MAFKRGTIRRKGNRFQVDTYVGPDRVRRIVDTKAEAQDLLESLNRADAIAGPYLSLEAVLTNYVNYLRGLRRKQTSINMFEAHGRPIVRHFGPATPIMELTTDAIAAFVDAQLKKVSVETVNNELSVLRASMKWATSDDARGDKHLRQLPCNIRLLKKPKKKPTVLTVEQVALVRSHARAPYDTALFIAAHAGLRHTELRHLWVRDIDLAAGEIRVASKPGWSPKSGEDREVPINRHLRAELERYLGTLNNPQPTDWLFPGIAGPLDSMCGPVREAFERAGLYDRERRPGLHMLRRTFASDLLGGGVDIETVMELGGWANLSTVQRYLASTSDRKRAAVEQLGS